MAYSSSINLFTDPFLPYRQIMRTFGAILVVLVALMVVLGGAGGERLGFIY